MSRSPDALLSDVIDLSQEIMAESRFTGGMVVHYTGLSTLRSMLAAEASQADSGRMLLADGSTASTTIRQPLTLRLYDAETMDDPVEGQFLLESSRDSDTRNGRAVFELFKGSVGGIRLLGLDPGLTLISSFTTESDALPLWRYYGRVAMQFPLANVPQIPIYRVRYGQDAEGVARRLGWVVAPILSCDDDKIKALARAAIRPLRFLFKPQGHAADAEVRPILEVRRNHGDFGSQFRGNGLIDMGRVHLDCASGEESPRRLFAEWDRAIFAHEDDRNEVRLAPQLVSRTGDGGLAYVRELRYLLHRRGLLDVRVTTSKHRLQGR